MSEARSALAGFETGDLIIDVEDSGIVGQVTLKGDLANVKLASALNSACGTDVPGPLTIVFGETGTRVVWMAPDEVLILLDGGEQAAVALVEALGAGLGDAHCLVANVTDTRAVLRLSGALVPEVLAKGAPIDLSPTAFPIGHARRTHMAGLAVAIWRLDTDTWEIVCLRSYAHHLWAWLEVSAVQGSQVEWT